MTTKEFYTALKAEITVDPEGLGYGGQSDQWVTDKLNALGTDQEVVRDLIQTSDIVVSLLTDPDEFDGLVQLEVSKLILIASSGSIDPAKLQSVFLNTFPNETRPLTRAALIALAKRECSRAEKLGLPVKLDQVENALHETWWDI